MSKWRMPEWRFLHWKCNTFQVTSFISYSPLLYIQFPTFNWPFQRDYIKFTESWILISNNFVWRVFFSKVASDMNFNRNLKRSYFILWTKKMYSTRDNKDLLSMFHRSSNRIIDHVHLVLVHLKFVCYISHNFTWIWYSMYISVFYSKSN